MSCFSCPTENSPVFLRYFYNVLLALWALNLLLTAAQLNTTDLSHNEIIPMSILRYNIMRYFQWISWIRGHKRSDSSSENIRGQIRSRIAQNQTVLVWTHKQESSCDDCSRIWLIDFGEENINQTAAIVQVKRTGNNVMVWKFYSYTCKAALVIKSQFCLHLLTHELFLTCMSFFLLFTQKMIF